MFGNQKGVGCPFLAVDVQPESAAKLQFHQRRQFGRALFHGAQLLPADAGQVKDGRNSGGGGRVERAGLYTAQPERRAGTFFRSVIAKREQLRRQRLHLWSNAFPQPFGIRPQHRGRGNLIACGKSLRGRPKSSHKTMSKSFTHSASPLCRMIVVRLGVSSPHKFLCLKQETGFGDGGPGCILSWGVPEYRLRDGGD